MSARWIDIKAGDGGRFQGYLSTPPTGNGPGILLIQEIFGVNRHIRTVADQYALDGFVVLAPDVFWRSAPRVDLGYVGADFQQGLDLLGKMDFKTGIEDLRASVAALRGLPECTGKVASLGYCMGGLLSYLVAASGTVDGAVCYYGGGISEQLSVASQVRCPIVFHFAANDGYIPAAAVAAVRGAFAGQAAADLHVYPGVDHGFNCWDRAMYNQHAAALARGRTLEFLAGL